jgi:hypothetical protein
MPAPKFLAGLPKPVLFGLYGAVGGLLGALVLGELIMAVLGPKRAEAAQAPPPEPRLAMVASSDLQIYQGGTNRLFVQILRDEFQGDVSVRVEGLPPGVTASEVVIRAGKDSTEVELRAAFGAAPGGPAPVRVVATARPGGKEVTDTAAAKLTTLAAPMPQADIVFVLDVTASMQGQIDGLKEGIGTFAADLARAKVDARFACLAFRDLEVGEPSELLKFKGETFTSNPAAFRGEVARLRASGGDDPPESSLEAIAEAAEISEWRKSAVRTLVLITDAPPKLGREGKAKEVATQALRDNKIDFLHLVTNPDGRPIYLDVQRGAGDSGDDKAPDRGKVFDLNRVARDPGAMTTRLLPEMTKAIVAAAEAKRPESKPELAKRPDGRPTLPVVKGVHSSETYEKKDSGRLVLAVGVWTGAIAALVCLALLAGQHHYLRGTLPPAGGVLAALGGGLVVGAVGGTAGQGLFLLADTDSAAVDAVFRLMGWTIFGSLAGAGLSLFVPNLKAIYGLGGGAVGGAVGAVSFIVVSGVLRAISLPPSVADVLGRLAGGLALGLFIGLMVAAVEAAFRRAWLEVRYGPREVVTVNLGPEPVKVGSDARACTVWARGAAGVELRYFVRDGQVICTDVPSRSEEVVRDGDTRAAGNVSVVVRTGSGVAPPAPKVKERAATPQAAPAVKPAELPPMLELDEEPEAKPAKAHPAVVKPPVPRAATPQGAPAGKPAIAPAARDPDACPGCRRKVPGRPGARYCMVCDQTY